MLTAPLFSKINVRDAGGRYPRAVLRISLQDHKKALAFMRKLEPRVPMGYPKLGVDRGRVVAEGATAAVIADAIGWPEGVVEALATLAKYKGTPGVSLTPADVASRAVFASRLVSVVADVAARAVRL